MPEANLCSHGRGNFTYHKISEYVFNVIRAPALKAEQVYSKMRELGYCGCECRNSGLRSTASIRVMARQ